MKKVKPFLVLLAVLGLSIGNAPAKPAPFVYVGGAKLDETNRYYVNGAAAPSGTLNGATCTASFDPATGTLHLHNFNGNSGIAWGNDASSKNTDLIINLIGTNKFSNESALWIAGIRGDYGGKSALIISAKSAASLSIDAKSTGASVVGIALGGSGILTINGYADVTVKATGNSKSENVRGIECGTFSILEHASYHSTTHSSANLKYASYGSGIQVNNHFTVNTTGDVIVDSQSGLTNPSVKSSAISCQGEFRLEKVNTMVLKYKGDMPQWPEIGSSKFIYDGYNISYDWNIASQTLTYAPLIPVRVNITAIGGITPPVSGQTPVTAITETDQYTGTVTWSGNPVVFGNNTPYTATITLAPKLGYTLTGIPVNFFTVTGATSVINGTNSGTITATFPKTGAGPVNIAEIGGITPPVAGEKPVTKIVETSQYTGTVTWSNDPAIFGYGTTYNARITLTPKTGYTLTGVPANFFTVAGTEETYNLANCEKTYASTPGEHITAYFPATATNPGKYMSISTQSGALIQNTAGTATFSTVTANITGGDAIEIQWVTDQTGNNVTSAPASITPSITLLPDNKATITMTAAGTVSAGTFYFRYRVGTGSPYYFSNIATLTVISTDLPISISEIEGLTPPVYGETPVTTILETEQFTGTVDQWYPSHATFGYDTEYTALIYINPKTGYTRAGLSESFFNAAGAESITNAGDFALYGGLYVNFPATETEPVKFIHVGEQDRFVMAGKISIPEFTVTVANIPDGSYNPEFTVGNPPPGGVTIISGGMTVSGGIGTLRLTVNVSAATGVYDDLTFRMNVGGNFVTSLPFTLTISEFDDTPPTVEAVVPDGTKASIDGSIVIQFSEPMNMISGKVWFNDNESAPLINISGDSKACEWSADKTMLIIPYSGLDYDKTYTISISGFMDRAGIYLGNKWDYLDNSHSFKTSVESDLTPPVLSAGNAIRKSGTEAAIGFSTTKAGTAYYLVLKSGDIAPENLEVLYDGTIIGDVTAGANSGIAIVLTAGAKDIYVVVVDDVLNISDPLKIEVSATIDIDETAATQIKIYPNPTNDVLNFSSETAFEIIDLQGKVVLKSEKAVKSVSIGGLLPGVYFVKLTTEAGELIRKIIKGSF